MPKEKTVAAKPLRRKKGDKRRATQNRIMDAFERVLVRDGVDGLGINAIVSEAEVGKGLIYHYFGGLDGLASQWMKRAELAPSEEEIAGMDLEEFRQLPARERLAKIHSNYATMLRNRPAACEILAQDLKTGASLPALLEDVRMQIGRSHEALVTSDPAFASKENVALIFVLQAAANYLALRAHASPNYNGVALDTEEGWQTVMSMVESVAGGDKSDA
ncbi:MAG: TetR/AcrR family transcriptional regulator [Halioglobus sp.]|nr:TetR/AcrR family transcriptional regulator [Halioglobus sp.]